MRFTVVPLASILTDALDQEALLAPYRAGIEAAGGEIGSAESTTWQAPVFFLLTGGTEAAALEAWQAYRTRVPRAGLLLLAHPGNNSLPAALETLARARQEGAAGRIIYLTGPRDSAGWQALGETIHAFTVWETLTQTRLGLIGKPSDWLVASSPAPERVTEVWGPQVIPISMEEVLTEMDRTSPPDLAEALADLTRDAEIISEPQSHDLETAARVYVALTQLARTYALDALTIRCFDLVLMRRTTGCYALARLSESGLIAGCEGDLSSAIGMLWAHQLLGLTPWMANPARVNAARNALILAHCTVPRTLVSRHKLRSHFESGLGVGLQGTFAPGPVTLLRVGGTDLRQLWVAEGMLLPTSQEENLCRTQAEIELSATYRVNDLLERPLGNHLVLVPGHHAATLRAWHQAMVESATP